VKFPSLKDLSRLALLAHKENKRFISQLKKMQGNRLDETFHSLHHEAFEQFDCLTCANCCKLISPMVTHNDINRLSLNLKVKPSEIASKHLDEEPDGTFVFKLQPCPFLASDNFCLVYKDRPKACAGYPHTDRRRMSQLMEITLKNTFICPVVYAIVEELKRKVNSKS
jgi:uncharacterized protein